MNPSPVASPAMTTRPRTGMTRRGWLELSAVATGLLVLGGSVGWVNRHRLRWLQPSDIEASLREHFSYLDLQISSEVMRQFAADYTQHYGQTERGGWYGFLRRKPAAHFAAQWDELATTFLLSTDFFLHGADESRPVRYVMLYHPYVSPCWNPIALCARAAEAGNSLDA